MSGEPSRLCMRTYRLVHVHLKKSP